MEQKVRINIAAETDRGKKRSKNEDYYGIFEPESQGLLEEYGLLAVVADGMGGTERGGRASRVAVEAIKDSYFGCKRDDVSSRLREAFLSANEAVFSEVAQGVEHSAGTTCTAAVFLGNELYVANAGDSRGYLLRGGRIEQLTTDHSLTSRLIKEGRIRKEEARNHPGRTVLTSSIGMRKNFIVDITGPIRLLPQDRVLLATDGLFNMVDDEKIAEILSSSSPEVVCAELINGANRAGGVDNITVIVAEVVQY